MFFHVFYYTEILTKGNKAIENAVPPEAGTASKGGEEIPEHRCVRISLWVL